MKVRPKRTTDQMARRRAHRDHALRRLRDLAGRSRRAKHTAARKSAQLSHETPSRKEIWRLSPIVSSASGSVSTGCWKYSRAEKIQTSFFPTGITVQNYPEIFKEIAEQGHEVGTETWIHDYSYMKKRDKEKKDLQENRRRGQKGRGEGARRLSFHGSSAERVNAGNYFGAGLHLLDGPAAPGNALHAQDQETGIDGAVLFSGSERLLELSARRQDAA